MPDRAVTSTGWDLATYKRNYDHLMERAKRAEALLTDVVVAAGRMRDDWAEADDAVKNQLWRDLHAAAAVAEHKVYPL